MMSVHKTPLPASNAFTNSYIIIGFRHVEWRLVASQKTVKADLRRVIKIELEIVTPDMEDADIKDWVVKAMDFYCDFYAGRCTILSSQLATVIGVQEADSDEGVEA